MAKMCVVVFIAIMYIYFLQIVTSCASNVPISCGASHVPATCARLPWWSGSNVKPDCPPYHFHIPEFPYCHPWLTCSDLHCVSLKELIGFGAVKAVYRAQWNNINVVYSVLNSRDYAHDFQHGLSMLKIFHPSPFVVQLIGYCVEENVILTEYHELGNAVNITNVISTKQKNNLRDRLGLCLNYVYLLEFLHTSPAGIRVFCDSNTLEKLLTQLLVTDKLTLVLNDLDALPEVNKENDVSIKCGHAKISGTFVAPEQLWVSEQPYDDAKMPGYDEKTDIWKSVAVCRHFLGDTVKTNIVAQYYLFALHESCTSKAPQERPTAASLVKEYSNIIEILSG